MPGSGEFSSVCSLVAQALSSSVRSAILDDVSASPTLGHALARLDRSLQSNAWLRGSQQINLDKPVRELDRRTRQDGFHVLHDWDGRSDRVNDQTIPSDVLRYLVEKRGAEPVDRHAVAILLDYYFLHVLTLLSVRIWDEGDADENLGRVGALLDALQGPDGSGQRFADDAETLILIATSHYERNEQGFDTLLERARGLDERHRARIALGHASSMGCHLRFGFEAQCGRDMVALRDDNVADYPWLCFALANVMQEYARFRAAGVAAPQRKTVVEAILNGLTPDARAFIGEPAASLARSEAERTLVRELFLEYRNDLLEEFEEHRPSTQAYSPLALFFNFSHNLLKGAVIDALIWGEPGRLGLNDLLKGSTDEEDATRKIRLATTLMGYARSSPDRIRGRLMPVIVYDPPLGRQAFSVTMRKLRES
jgi:hypothetical protein